MIYFKNVRKEYPDGTVALDDINFHIKKGEFVYIVGPSGAGKSTLTKLLMHEELPTSGDITINNQRVNTLKPQQIPYLRRDIGVIFQDFRLLDDRTVFENVAFAMRVVGASKKEIRNQVPQLLSMVGLSKKSKLLPTQLSRGEAQRVAVARALANNPPVLVADEPTASLPPKTSFEIVELLEDINRRGTTVIMSTHSKDIVDNKKKRVLEIYDGKLIRDEYSGGYDHEKAPEMPEEPQIEEESVKASSPESTSEETSEASFSETYSMYFKTLKSFKKIEDDEDEETLVGGGNKNE